MRLCRWDDKENRSTGIRLSVERSPWIESRQFSVVFPSTGCRPDCVISTSRNDSVARVKNQDPSLGVSSLFLFLFATLLLSRWQCLGKSFDDLSAAYRHQSSNGFRFFLRTNSVSLDAYTLIRVNA